MGTFMALSEDPPRSKLIPVNPDAFAEPMSNGMTQAYRDATLTEHNQLRRTIVQASDMIELTYDMQLEAVAQNYLNSLGSGSFSHNSRAATGLVLSSMPSTAPSRLMNLQSYRACLVVEAPLDGLACTSKLAASRNTTPEYILFICYLHSELIKECHPVK